MRSLRVVGITEDGSVVLEDSARRERFTVPADEQLRAAARGDLTRLGQIAIELESQLRPREIQARIRAGASVEQVASAAGVPVQKIERFAYPVLLERTRTADLARNAHPVRQDGPDVRTLAETVAHTFGLRGQDHTGTDWDSWKGEDGRWVVALCWRTGRSDIRAHFTFQPGAHGGTVTALDDHARDLVEGRPQQPLRPVGPVIDIARPEEPVAEPVETASVPAAVNGDGPRIAPEQRRASVPGTRSRTRSPEPRTESRTESRSAEARVDARTEVRSELVAEPVNPPVRPPAHPATRSTDTRSTDTRSTATTDTRTPLAEEPRVSAPADVEDVSPTAGTPTDVQDATGEPAESPEVLESREAAAEPTPAVTTSATPDPVRETASPEPEPAGPEQPAAAQPASVQPAPAEAEEPEAAAPPATAEGPATSAAPRRTKKGKPVMPSWDEVLLGVRGR
ncbi:hypothetical protein GCM10009836_57450 [Pseudonocardia ailaonensis]|uniref:DUF3071 domain-containing protein n=1 Tax=Pseudonocardia ailaonensis TaxID=367279 RepID=A0ABN2NIG8_9PSEU